MMGEEGRLSPALIERLAAIVGREHALTDPGQQLPYLREWRDLYQGRAGVVLRPGSTEEVSRILALANALGLGVVPQAGNTGLVGGQIPFNGDILLSVARLQRLREIDAAGYSLTVEAGVTLAEVQAAAAGGEQTRRTPTLSTGRQAMPATSSSPTWTTASTRS